MYDLVSLHPPRLTGSSRLKYVVTSAGKLAARIRRQVCLILSNDVAEVISWQRSAPHQAYCVHSDRELI